MKKQPKDLVQPDKGVGCKLGPKVYRGIAAGLVAGRTVADLAETYGVVPSTVSVLRHRHFESIPEDKRRLATQMGMVAEMATDRMIQKLESRLRASDEGYDGDVESVSKDLIRQGLLPFFVVLARVDTLGVTKRRHVSRGGAGILNVWFVFKEHESPSV